MQGIVTGLTREADKNVANAPAFATYIHIRMKDGSSYYDYIIYPGENNVNDFNIAGNRQYQMNIDVGNGEDARCSILTIEIWEDGEHGQFCPVVYPLGIGVVLPVDKVRDSECKITVKGDCGNDIFINNRQCYELTEKIDNYGYCEFFIQMDVSYLTEYIPFEYTVSFTDIYGYEHSYTDSKLFCNLYKVGLKLFNGLAPGGTVGYDGIDYTTYTDNGFLFMCIPYAENFTLSARQQQGYGFGGWYYDRNFSIYGSSSYGFPVLSRENGGTVYCNFTRY